MNKDTNESISTLEINQSTNQPPNQSINQQQIKKEK